MRRPRPVTALAVTASAALVGGLLAAAALAVDEPAQAAPALPSSAPVVAPSPSRSPSASPSPSPTVAAPVVRPQVVRPTPSPTPAAGRRASTSTGWGPYATVGPVTLHYPGDRVEVVGLHESGHDGAQPQQPRPGQVRTGALESRERGTTGQGAADIVVDPGSVVRAPVTGRVLRAGTYALYCDHTDQYLVVEPDARPGWEVKLLHFAGLAVGVGDRVQAGVTVVGAGARTLPFASQVDEFTVAPHWPHVHVEVVDPSVPDRPGTGSCD